MGAALRPAWTHISHHRRRIRPPRARVALMGRRRRWMGRRASCRRACRRLPDRGGHSPSRHPGRVRPGRTTGPPGASAAPQRSLTFDVPQRSDRSAPDAVRSFDQADRPDHGSGAPCALFALVQRPSGSSPLVERARQPARGRPGLRGWPATVGQHRRRDAYRPASVLEGPVGAVVSSAPPTGGQEPGWPSGRDSSVGRARD